MTSWHLPLLTLPEIGADASYCNAFPTVAFLLRSSLLVCYFADAAAGNLWPFLVHSLLYLWLVTGHAKSQLELVLGLESLLINYH